jgi:hypothetical protein
MAAHTPIRLPHRHAVDPGRDVLEAVAHQHRRRAARDLDALDRADARCRATRRASSVLGRHQARQLLEVLLEQLLEREHRRARADRRRFAPARERRGAARTAASTSFAGDNGVLAMTTPRAGLVTLTCPVADDATQRPPMKLDKSVVSAIFLPRRRPGPARPVARIAGAAEGAHYRG